MTLPLRPILSSLRHHQLTAGLLALQVALTCAIVANAMFMIVGRIERVDTPTGLPEREISMISVQGLQQDANPAAQQATDLAALRALPGVTAAAAVGWTLPLSGGADDYGVCASQAALDYAKAARSMDDAPGCVQATRYNGSPGFLEAMGAHLVSGRGFRADEYDSDHPRVAIVTRSLAQRLWPGQDPLGKSLLGSDRIVVIGVVEDILRPMLRTDALDRLATLSPQPPNGTSTRYLLRSAPPERERVLAEARLALARSGPMRLIPAQGQRTFTEMRHAYFRRDTTMIGLLLASAIALLFVTALGIGGLANFWVQQRTRQIGIRRAIGATRGDILSYFRLENFLIVSFGVALGMLMAFGLNQLLMRAYELQRLPLWYLPLGAATLWLLGQLAVLGPARRAAAVPPAVATRTL